jgi:hypothetical protein
MKMNTLDHDRHQDARLIEAARQWGAVRVDETIARMKAENASRLPRWLPRWFRRPMTWRGWAVCLTIIVVTWTPIVAQAVGDLWRLAVCSTALCP